MPLTVPFSLTKFTMSDPLPIMTPSKPVAIVTGASSGIGLSIARHLSEAGYRVFGGARNMDRLEAVGSSSLSNTFTPIQLDLSEDKSIVSLVDIVLSECARIDVLVNNAGYPLWGAVEDVPIDEARKQMEVNLFAIGRLCQLVLPHMRAQRYGRIINISSTAGEICHPLCGWYAASKFALEGLSNVLRMEAAPFGVQVVVMQPGATSGSSSMGVAADTGMDWSATGPWGPWMNKAAKHVRQFPESQMVDASVVAKAVVKAAQTPNPRARYIVGWMTWIMFVLGWYLPIKWMDWMMMKAMGCEAEQLL